MSLEPVEQLLRHLDHPDPETRALALERMDLAALSTDEALRVCRKGLADADYRVAGTAHYPLNLLGHSLSDADLATLEQALTHDPDDLAARVVVLGAWYGRGIRSPEARARATPHREWMIANHPGSEAAGMPHAGLIPRSDPGSYERSKTLWLQNVAIHRDNRRVLANAAHFFTLHERDIAYNLFRTLKSLSPDDPQWPHRLGDVICHERFGASADQGTDWATRAYAEFALAARLAGSGVYQATLLVSLARTALAAGMKSQAREAAEALLALNPSDDFAGSSHVAHTVLGRLALADGQPQSAIDHLHASAKRVDSPVHTSFGPNMSLARDLLEAGERREVLDFFTTLDSQWPHGADRLAKWAAQVERGEMPEFGGNLVY